MKTMKTDFHIHTCCSDGAYTPSEIVLQYKARGYDAIAITDHDTVDGVKEAMQAGKEAGLAVVPGIEFSTEGPGSHEMHILGYNIDLECKELLEELEGIMTARRNRNIKMLAYINGLGYDITWDDLSYGKRSDYIGKPDFGRAMARRGFIEKPIEIFSDKLLESPEALKIKKEMISDSRALELIKLAGGLSVIAHPMKIYGIGERGSEEFYKNFREMVIGMIDEGLGGIECYHVDHTLEQSERLVQIAEEFGLVVTMGSDFHGNDFRRRLGIGDEIENVRIDDKYVDILLGQARSYNSGS